MNDIYCQNDPELDIHLFVTEIQKALKNSSKTIKQLGEKIQNMRYG